MQSEKLLLRSDKTPRPSKPGIILSGPSDGKCRLDNDAWIHGALALGPADLEWMPAQSWFRCMLLCGVSLANQFAYSESVLGDLVVFPEELQEQKLADGSTLNVLAFNIELIKTLKFPRHKGTFFVHANCLAYRSDILEIKCD